MTVSVPPSIYTHPHTNQSHTPAPTDARLPRLLSTSTHLYIHYRNIITGSINYSIVIVCFLYPCMHVYRSIYNTNTSTPRATILYHHSTGNSIFIYGQHIYIYIYNHPILFSIKITNKFETKNMHAWAHQTYTAPGNDDG
jgi:hypothetical protein